MLILTNNLLQRISVSANLPKITEKAVDMS